MDNHPVQYHSFWGVMNTSQRDALTGLKEADYIWNSDNQRTEYWVGGVWRSPVFPATAEVIIEEFTYDPGVNLFDAVYLVSADHVGKADASNLLKIPARGIVVEFYATDKARVMLEGEVGFPGLISGSDYFLSETFAGGIKTNPDPAVARVLQKVGWARSGSVLVVEMSTEYLYGV